VAHPRSTLALVVASVAEPCLDLAPEAAHCGRRDDALRCAADAHDGVDAGPRHGAADGGRQVAVGDELDPRPDIAKVGDELLVSGSVEDDDRDVVRTPSQRCRDPLDVLLGRKPNVDVAGGDRPDAQLLEIRVRGVNKTALLGGGEHRDRVGQAESHEVRALEWIDRDVDLRGRPPVVVVVFADLLADVQHRRLVAFALADDDRARHVELVHRPAHRLGRRAIGLMPVAPAHVPRGCDRGRLRDPDHLEGEKLFQGLPLSRTDRVRQPVRAQGVDEHVSARTLRFVSERAEATTGPGRIMDPINVENAFSL
jgi:hypothetical protein